MRRVSSPATASRRGEGVEKGRAATLIPGKVKVTALQSALALGASSSNGRTLALTIEKSRYESERGNQVI